MIAAQGLLRLSYIEYALLGSCAIYLVEGTTTRERVTLVAVAVMLGIWARLGGAEDLLSLRSAGYLLGLAAIAMAGVRAAGADSFRRRRVLETAAAVVLFPLFVSEALLVRRALKDAAAPTYDLYALLADGRLGGQLSYALGRWFADWPWMDQLLWEVYTALPFMLGLLYAFTRRGTEPGRALRAALLLFTASFLAVVGYRIVPVSGPLYAFAGFPWQQPQVTPGELHRLFLSAEIERNAVPSLHFASALLVWWNLRRLGNGLRAACSLFLVGTFLATLATGEHYLIDLVVTVPFALALQAGFMAPKDALPRWKLGAVAFGGGLTMFWVLALRSAPFVSGIPRPALVALAALSFGVPFVLERRLWTQNDTRRGEPTVRSAQLQSA